MFAPVIHEARSDSRNATTSATSGSEPSRPNGNSPAWKAAKSSGFCRWKVSQPPPGNMIDPGLTAFTRMRSGASSWAAMAARWIAAAWRRRTRSAVPGASR